MKIVEVAFKNRLEKEVYKIGETYADLLTKKIDQAVRKELKRTSQVDDEDEFEELVEDTCGSISAKAIEAINDNWFIPFLGR